MAFARSDIVTSISIDDNVEPQIRLNFNVTFFALHCDYVVVDVWDSLGANRQNITKNVEKWQLDANGVRRIFSGRNRETREVKHQDHDLSLDEMHANGVHAELLDQKTFQSAMKENDFVFVNFHVPWCVWCQRLAPTWEMFAEEAHEKKMPLKIASVNCVENPDVCRAAQVRAFPTIRWYQDGDPVSPDYKQDRTVSSLVGFAQRKIQLLERYKDWDKKEKDKSPKDARMSPSTSRPENPGCQISGHLLVNRVPGNFHVEARSKNHNLNAAMTNLTHRVNHLSFGEEMSKNYKTKRILKQVPDEHKQFNPIDHELYTTSDFHQAWHHYIKVVSTHLELDSGSGRNSLMTYQFLEQSQVVYYDVSDVPEARFSYDISPISVVVNKESRKWYDYLTSLCAIIGGSFTTLGLVDSFFYTIFKEKKS